MPALVNISVGSSLITIGAEGTIRCPLERKNSLKDSRISFAVRIFYLKKSVNVLIKRRVSIHITPVASGIPTASSSYFGTPNCKINHNFLILQNIRAPLYHLAARATIINPGMVMGKRVFYLYNPNSDSYERFYPSLWTRLLSALRVLLLAALIGVGIYFLIFYLFASPTEENLMQENAQLKKKIREMDARVQNSLKVMEDIRNRDDNFYRVMMQIEPMSQGQRFAGLSSDKRYRDLANMPDAKILTELARSLDILERGLYTQSISFDQLRKAVTNRSDKLAHIPSILPINVADYTISSGYGNRIDPIYGTTKFHAGLDFPADPGDAVFSTAKGRVVFAGWKGGYGNCIDIDHGYNYLTRYGHLNKILVKQGQEVVRGDKIGEVGSTGKSTGPHLHYEVRFKDEPQNPVNYYFMDLTPEQYTEMTRQAENAGHVMD